MKTDDGRYYAFGFFREDGGWNDSYQGPVVRKDWLDECGLEIPETISEFENVIRVFNEKYGATFNSSFSVRYKAEGVAGAFGAYGERGCRERLVCEVTVRSASARRSRSGA